MKIYTVIGGLIFFIYTYGMIQNCPTNITDEICHTLLYGNHQPPYPAPSENICLGLHATISSQDYGELLNCAIESMKERLIFLRNDTSPMQEFGSSDYAMKRKICNAIIMLQLQLLDHYWVAIPSFVSKNFVGDISVPQKDIIDCVQWSDGGDGWQEESEKSTTLTFTTGKKLHITGQLAHILYDIVQPSKS